MRFSVTMPSVTEPLRYRDGREGIVDPVLIERNADGSVRILVNYPPAARRSARNRFLFTLSAAVAFFLSGRLAARSLNIFFGFFGSLSFLGAAAAVLFGILWVQSSWTYVFEASSKELCLERRGRFCSRRNCFPRQGIRDVQLATKLRGGAVALEIQSTHQKLPGRYFEYLDEQSLEQIAAALREGLALMPPVEAK